MPYAFIQLSSRKEGTTLAEYKKHFEEKFVPLVKEVCGPVFPLAWQRRYVAHDGNDKQRIVGALNLPALLIGRDEELPFDCLSEMTFEDELHFQQFFARINEEEPAEKMLGEESKFADPAKMKFMIMENWTDVNEYRTHRDPNATFG